VAQVLYRAAWVLPIGVPPVRDGWVVVRDGRIVQVGHGAAHGAGWADLDERDLGARVILPGLVNAHTHLELAHLRGRVSPARSMPLWVCDLLAARGVDLPPAAPIAAAIGEARRAGTALVGDVSNSLASVVPLIASPLWAVVFHELLGFSLRDAEAHVRKAIAAMGSQPASEHVRCSLAVHAPYSSSPDLFRTVWTWCGAATPAHPMGVHLGESPEEVRFLDDGGGPWRELLESLRAWNPKWTPPKCGPVEYLDRLGVLGDHLVVAHGVQLAAPELARLRDVGATIVTCPRSNQWVGVGPPPVERFYASGVAVAIGTDSLASVEDLNLFTELAELRRLAPAVPARALLESVTRRGAVALGFGDTLGALAPGFCAEIIAVDVPRDVTDVEEYLVGGIRPEQVSWIGDAGDPD
jgi:cytosine/adenosine deaminase-related metal-dependent hydrolase